jgi:hypothetical protein
MFLELPRSNSGPSQLEQDFVHESIDFRLFAPFQNFLARASRHRRHTIEYAYVSYTSA